MSGGYFNYQQHNIDDIIEELESVVHYQNEAIGRGYSAETYAHFYTALKHLKLASIYTQRIDWLLEGDDNEESFHKRLKSDIEELT